MKKIILIAILASAGTMGIVASEASALTCTTPAPGEFGLLRGINSYLPCSSFNGGVSRRARATVSRPSQQQTSLRVNLHEGTSALAFGYTSTRTPINGCVVQDITPDETSATKNCGQTVSLFDLTVVDDN